jgi:glycosyltransferase involved in cell wall biosynthesis
MNVSLIVMTLNEIEGMKAIMPKVDRSLFCQILVVDGDSKDGTVEYARENGYEVYIQKKKGIRYGYVEAYPLIKGDAVITFSPDGNSKPEDLPALVDKIKEGYDMVIASRHGLGAKSNDDDLITGFGNWIFTKSINFFHGGHYTDAMGIYRAYKTELFNKLDLLKDESYSPEKWFGTNVSIEPLLSIRAAKKKLNIAEIPSDEPERLGGERKLQILRWGATFYVQILRELFYWK